MAENDSKRYYWIKLKADFFEQKEIKIIEAMQNGKDYVLFYLKILCAATTTNGNLRFNDLIPYSVEMLATITNTNVDIVRAAIHVLQTLNLIEVLDDGTIYLDEVCRLTGSESGAAQRKREYREKLKGDNVPQVSHDCPELLDSGDNVPQVSRECPLDIEIDKEIDIYKNLESNNSFHLFDDETDDIFEIAKGLFVTKEQYDDVNKLIKAIGTHELSATKKSLLNYLFNLQKRNWCDGNGKKIVSLYGYVMSNFSIRKNQQRSENQADKEDDSLPVYDTSKNRRMSDEEIEKLLALRNVERLETIQEGGSA